MEIIKKYWWALAAIIVVMMMGKKKRKTTRRRRSMGRMAARMVYRRPMRNSLGGYRSYAGMKPRRRASRMRRR